MKDRSVLLNPTLRNPATKRALLTYVRTLTRHSEISEPRIQAIKSKFVALTRKQRGADSLRLLSAGLVITDLYCQGWAVRASKRGITVIPPVELKDDLSAEKGRIRRQELLKRDAQLREPSVKAFVRQMEKPREYRGSLVSIFSLMRDGRELSKNLKEASLHLDNGWAPQLAQIVDPYLEFVSSDKAVCEHTGLRLMDIWRYFRHTWTNQHSSVPGRGMLILVRDRAAPNHPVMGIAALSSPIVQLRNRDLWIGWHPERFVDEIRKHPTAEIASWLVSTVDRAVSEIYIDDFLEDQLLSVRDLVKPSEAKISALLREGEKQRKLHHRFVRARDLKTVCKDPDSIEFWVTRARTHLFRSKRAITLAGLLRCRLQLQETFRNGATAKKLEQLLSARSGSDTVKQILRKAKADRVGIAVADISVCGAVQPYNAILGGKLVAMLAASPEVVAQYRSRYEAARSEIASAMAGRPIVRTPSLVLFGTTSLYGVGSSQYNRIRIPCERIGGPSGKFISYNELGHSEAFGTSHYSEETVEALLTLVQQSSEGQRVNSIFGEGVSPKMRKVRTGLDLLGLDSAALLRHHRKRVIYGIPLIENLQRFLLGLDSTPKYLAPIENAEAVTREIAAWWRERWLKNRITSHEVLESVAQHTLVRPVTHGARVPIQRSDLDVNLNWEQQELI